MRVLYIFIILIFLGCKKEENKQPYYVNDPVNLDFIKTYVPVAKTIAQKYDLDYEYVLASACFHSNFGKSFSHKNLNNTFNIECKEKCDDPKHCLKTNIGVNLIKYYSCWESFDRYCLVVRTKMNKTVGRNHKALCVIYNIPDTMSINVLKTIKKIENN